MANIHYEFILNYPSLVNILKPHKYWHWARAVQNPGTESSDIPEQKTGISEAGQRRKQYQAEVGVTGTGSEFQGRAVRGQTQR